MWNAGVVLDKLKSIKFSLIHMSLSNVKTEWWNNKGAGKFFFIIFAKSYSGSLPFIQMEQNMKKQNWSSMQHNGALLVPDRGSFKPQMQTRLVLRIHGEPTSSERRHFGQNISQTLHKETSNSY